MNEHEVWVALNGLRGLPDRERERQRKRVYRKAVPAQRASLKEAERLLENLWHTERTVIAECDAILLDIDARIDMYFPVGEMRARYLRAIADFKRATETLQRPRDFADERAAGDLLDLAHRQLRTVQNAVWAFGTPSG